MEGHYVFVGWDDSLNDFAAWLYDNDGNHLHTWSWDYSDLDVDDGIPRNGSTMPKYKQDKR